MVTPIVIAVYVLGALTILSFLVFVFLLFQYLKETRQAEGAAAPGGAPPHADQLQAFNPQQILDSLGTALNATARLTTALTRARPVAISALLTILFLLCWLVSLTLLVFASTGH